ncbi:Nucleophile aminohydrolase [Gracilaria domingensis]|nr:Nucleophile aminohydrolase [Gracilaria domingensis]
MDPLWNYLVVAGWQHGKPLLGYVDLVGSHFKGDVIATGYGEYLGLPLLRKAYRDDITVEEGKKVVIDILKVLFYRDARTIDRVQIACVTEKGAVIEEPIKLETEWSFKAFISGARKSDVSTW